MIEDSGMNHNKTHTQEGIAIIGLGCVLPDARTVEQFWQNILSKKYSIGEVPPDEWSIEDYYDPDPTVPDKSYCKLGAFVRNFSASGPEFRIPPRVWEAMDEVQRWAIVATRDALRDANYEKPSPYHARTAVIVGNSMGGQNRLKTVQRLFFPEVRRVLLELPLVKNMDEAIRTDFLKDLEVRYRGKFPSITEDSMPGELSNIVSGRIANVFNLHGANYTADAACASSMAAMQAAIHGLRAGEFDMVISGAVDRSMSPDTFIKFSKIGALSGQGSCPFSVNAAGFVMGEGAAILVLKRVSDAERDGDRIYAVIRAIGSSSDGRGKGITAPNVQGQLEALQRAYEISGLSLRDIDFIEAHGTSTVAGDAAEIEALRQLLKAMPVNDHRIGISSVKSQIGHLKGAAGAAGLLKTVLSIHHHMLPPTINGDPPNKKLGLEQGPLYLIKDATPWPGYDTRPRRAGVSSFGFGGTNFHVIVEEYRPSLTDDRVHSTTRESVTASAVFSSASSPITSPVESAISLFPGRFIVAGADSRSGLERILRSVDKIPPGKESVLPSEASLAEPFRLALYAAEPSMVSNQIERAAHALRNDEPEVWNLLEKQGIFFGEGTAGKIAFLFPGQGSQYYSMGKVMRATFDSAAQRFTQADTIMTDRLERPLSSYIFGSEQGNGGKEEAEKNLKQTQVTQPTVLTMDCAVRDVLQVLGITPAMVIGHSLGEYAALVVAGVLSFKDALIAASARAREMQDLHIEDRGLMASVFAGPTTIEEVLRKCSGYVVAANLNSPNQTVIAGATEPVLEAIRHFETMGINCVLLQVSHAFHTEIVAPAAPRLRKLLEGMRISPPRIPIVSNVTGRFYPISDSAGPEIITLLEKQVASPVLFMTGIETLYEQGARVFIECGAKSALSGLAHDILGTRSHITIATNHPKKDDLTCLGNTLAACWASGQGPVRGRSATAVTPAPPFRNERMGTDEISEEIRSEEIRGDSRAVHQGSRDYGVHEHEHSFTHTSKEVPDMTVMHEDRYYNLGKALGDFLESVSKPGQAIQVTEPREPRPRPLVISGVSLGLPGRDRSVFDDANVDDILSGRNFIGSLSQEDRQLMSDKRITRLMKRAVGDPTLEEISSPDEVVHLAGMSGSFDLVSEFDVPADLAEGMNRPTAMAVAAGLLALRDAGIPLVQRYRSTTTGKWIPSHYALPEYMADETGVIFASAFCEADGYLREALRFSAHRSATVLQQRLRKLSERIPAEWQNSPLATEIQQQLVQLGTITPYQFSRKFIFQVLPMGNSQLAQVIGARGPNAHVNAACASTSVAVGIANDWIRQGRCKRVIIVGADDPTTETAREWIFAGLFALGAATAESRLDHAAVPFDRRRSGMISGMGAVGLVLEQPEEVDARGMRGMCELLGIDYGNSAFHVSRLDINHITGVMKKFISRMEHEHHLNRNSLADKTMFMSHETYTPARGGSAAAEVEALRAVFGNLTEKVVIANTKGFTGHAMGAGIEEVVTVKALQAQRVPPVANHRETDPELGPINLSSGGHMPVTFGLRFAAGFGSQLAVSLYRRIDNAEQRTTDRRKYTQWLQALAGRKDVELEVYKRVLRIKNGIDHSHEVQPHAVHLEPSHVERHEGNLPSEAISVKPKSPDQSIESAIEERLMVIVAEKTGYPRDMLELDLDLEADLGIDTVKQAEVFALVREEWQLPRREDLQLRDYPTLRHLVRFVLKETGQTTDERAVPDSHEIRQTGDADNAIATSTGATPVFTVEKAVEDRLLSIVAEKTGYPQDMLELDLDLEADLGIDTVKQAEVFALVREEWQLPRREDLQLRDYPTLRHLVHFVLKETGQTTEERAVPDSHESRQAGEAGNVIATSTGATLVSTVEKAVEDRLLSIVAEKTGYPRDMLDPDLDLEADLGIDTVKQAEVFALVREEWQLPRREDLQLRDYPTLRHLVHFVLKETGQTTDERAVPDSHESRQAGEAGNVIATSTEATLVSTVEKAVEDRLLSIVAEKTGYPRDMLDPDLDLEADLGIDTVKQAEVFALVREEWQLPRREDLQLRDYPTLRHLVRFVLGHIDQTPREHTAEKQRDDRSPQLKTAPDHDGVAEKDRERKNGSDTAAETELPPPLKRMVPVLIETALHPTDRASHLPASPLVILTESPMKELNGIVLSHFLAKNCRVVVLSDNEAGDVEPHENSEAVDFPIEHHLINFDDAEQVSSRVRDIIDRHGPLSGVAHLRSLERGIDVNSIDLGQFRRLSAQWMRSLFVIVQTAMMQGMTTESDGQSFIVAAVDCGGNLGMPVQTGGSPLAGAVAGLTKSIARELPGSMVKLVDVGEEIPPKDIAAAIIEEIYSGDRSVETSRLNGKRLTAKVVPQLLSRKEPSESLFKFDGKAVMLFTGGARGITARIARDFAETFRPRIVIADLIEPLAEPLGYNLDSAEDQQRLKSEIRNEMKLKVKRVTPVMIEREFAGLVSRHEARRTIESLEELGCQVRYVRCNVTDETEVNDLIGDTVREFGRLDVIVHGAGIEESRSIAHKRLEIFDRVFSVKADGCFNLNRAGLQAGVKAFVFFSSVAGRFGNAGQTDYAAANDLLNKWAAWINGHHRDGGPRAVAMNWTGWADIGMATRETIKQLFEQAGITLIPPTAGAPLVRRELQAGLLESEVIIAGNLGFIDAEGQVLESVGEGKASEPDASSEALPTESPVENRHASVTPLIDGIVSMVSGQSLVAKTNLSTARHLYLKDHAVDGVPLFPGVMGLELFAEGVQHMLAPGETVLGFEDVVFSRAVKIFNGRPLPVILRLQEIAGQDHHRRYSAVLESDFLDRSGQKKGDTRQHFSAVVLAGERPSAATESRGTVATQSEESTRRIMTREEIYELLFHGPCFQVCREVRSFEGLVLRAFMSDEVMACPPFEGNGVNWLVNPFHIELGFQAAGLNEYIAAGTFGLPHTIERMSFYPSAPEPRSPFQALVAMEKTGTRPVHTITVMDESTVMIKVEGYRTIQRAAVLPAS